MKKITSWVAILLTLVIAIPNVFAVSEAAVLFLLISPHARAGGMGEAFVAVADDASAVFWNPAGLAFQEGKQFTSMYQQLLPQFNLDDLYYLFGAYRQSIEGLGTVGFNITFANYGQQIITDETGPEALGTFDSNEFAITLSYATLFSENMAVGLNAKFIKSNLSEVGAGAEKGNGQASVFAIDLGLLKKNLFINNLNFGLNISNIGPKITYIDNAQADPLPTNFKIGFAYKAIDQEFNSLTLVADMNKLMVHRTATPTGETTVVNGETIEVLENKVDPVFEAFFSSWQDDNYIFNLGGEYWYANLIALRAGYYYDPDGKVKYLTIGAGLKYSIYQFDFGYISAGDNHPLSDTMRFSMTIGGQ